MVAGVDFAAEAVHPLSRFGHDTGDRGACALVAGVGAVTAAGCIADEFDADERDGGGWFGCRHAHTVNRVTSDVKPGEPHTQ